MSDFDIQNIITFENNEMDQEQTIKFFQGLINSGLAFTLQGSYGRTAKALIEAGHCTPRFG